MAETNSGRWTGLFRRKGIAGEDFLGKFLEGVSRILEGGDEGEAFQALRAEVTRIFECEDISLFVYDPDETPRMDEGDWVLTVRAGLGEGNRVCQADAKAMPSLTPGKRFPFSEQLASKAVLKTVALAFEEDAFYGCDIEKKIVLLKNPTPEDDLGSGDLSVLAIPLNFHNRSGRLLEKSRVGVLTLYKQPTQRNVGELEGFLRSIVAYAVTTPNCTLRDPVSSLYTEMFLREQLSVAMNMWQITETKLRGGMVVGMIDALKLYKQTLELEAKVDPSVISQRVSDVLRGVGRCIWRRSRAHTMAAGSDYKCGQPGRIGREGFGVILPLFKPVDLKMWAVRLARDVVETPFPGEEHLVTGDVTVSLRVIPFGFKGANSPADVWKTAREAIDQIEQDQVGARRDPAVLAKSVNTIRVLKEDGTWAAAADYSPLPGGR